MEREKKRRPALNPDEREKQMINLAINLAERQLMDGTASSQVISHFLKLGSTRDQIEKEMIVNQNELLKAKTEAIQGGKRVEELYEKALNAMKEYSGKESSDDI